MENTENNDDLILCSYCKNEFIPSDFKLHSLKNDDKFNKILEGILQTRLFCLKCSRYHTSIICVNSQILFPE